MPCNSHIQIPNCILKNFRNPITGKVFYWDLKNMWVRKCASSDLGTEVDYYSEEIETYLNKTVENPFYKLTQNIIKFIESDINHIKMQSDTEFICKRYISAAIYRSRLAQNEMAKSSTTAFVFSEQENHDDLVWFSLNQPNRMSPQLANYQMTVIANRTEKNFVVPCNCFYKLKSQKIECFIAPISPKCVLCFVPKNYNLKTIEVKNIYDPEDIIQMNIKALQFEYLFSCRFVATCSETELKDLMDYSEKNRTELEKFALI